MRLSLLTPVTVFIALHAYVSYISLITVTTPISPPPTLPYLHTFTPDYIYITSLLVSLFVLINNFQGLIMYKFLLSTLSAVSSCVLV